MENENSIRSIIYGNPFENKYGRFMPVCSSILDRCIYIIIEANITNILDYLK
jgi:hypothetical protein